MKRNLILLGILIVCLWVIYLFSTYSFIEIAVPAKASNQDVDYRITTKSGDQTGQLTGSAQSVRKLVRKGDYGVLVTRGDESYFANVTTGGFLRTAIVSASFTKENARSFIGNNPGPCVHLVDAVLLSQACHDPLNQVVIHVPASETQPTYTKPFGGAVTASLNGISTLPNGSFALLQESAPSLRSINAAGSLGEPLPLPDLLATKTYSIQKYGDGLVIYDDAGLDIVTYDTVGRQGQPLGSDGPKNKDLRLYSVSTHGTTLALTYANPDAGEDPHQNPAASQQNNRRLSKAVEGSEIILLANGTTKHLELKETPYRASLCGADRFCVLRVGGELTVFDIGSDKANRLYSLFGVVDITNSDAGTLLVTNSGVMRFDSVKREGYLAYSFGDYGFEAIYPTLDGFVATLVDAKEQLFALHVNITQENTDSIDKQIANLAQLTEIKNISVYKQIIYIQPELGKLERNPTSGRFEYNQAMKQAVKTVVDQKINELGIDRATYKIITPLLN